MCDSFECILYDFQTVVAGLLAFLGGAFVYAAARWQILERRRERISETAGLISGHLLVVTATLNAILATINKRRGISKNQISFEDLGEALPGVGVLGGEISQQLLRVYSEVKMMPSALPQYNAAVSGQTIDEELVQRFLGTVTSIRNRSASLTTHLNKVFEARQLIPLTQVTETQLKAMDQAIEEI